MKDGLITKNRKALHEYEILDRLEAGIVLTGAEVKAIREHKVNLTDSYAHIRQGEIWLENCHISPYSHSRQEEVEPRRSRKLLLHRREINRLLGQLLKKGFTLIPLSLYFKDGMVKVELALARGKRLYDKRETARRKTIQREIEAELKRR